MLKRRDFFKTGAIAGAGVFFSAQVKSVFGQQTPLDMVIVQEGDPRQMVSEALKAMGGMSRFIGRGDVVVLKPNISWDRVPEQAATTNPDVVAEVVKLCFEAGAKRVTVFDNTLNEAKRCYTRSGIEAAAKAEGADVEFIFERKFKEVPFPDGELVKSWEVYKDILEADKIINLPAAKHHSIGGVSLGMKNLMGVIGGNRGLFHRDFHTKIVDLSTRIKPDLVILDAYRMLLRNGPSGGNLADVRLQKTLAVGTDPIAMDSFGVTLFGEDPLRKPFLVEGAKRGLGVMEFRSLNMKTISLAS
jgi:uncharacterized protein (DUF362 family)